MKATKGLILALSDKKMKWAFVAVFAICLTTYAITTMNKEEWENNPFNGCYHVFVDVGPNPGTYLSMLFDPKIHPGVLMHDGFNALFERKNGTARDTSDICAIGLKLRPNEDIIIKELQKMPHSLGQTRFFTRMSEPDSRGSIHFFTNIPGGIGKHMELSEFINKVIGTRKIPERPDHVQPKVVLKVTANEMDLAVLPNLHGSGCFSVINAVIIEGLKEHLLTHQINQSLSNFFKRFIGYDEHALLEMSSRNWTQVETLQISY